MPVRQARPTARIVVCSASRLTSGKRLCSAARVQPVRFRRPHKHLRVNEMWIDRGEVSFPPRASISSPLLRTLRLPGSPEIYGPDRCASAVRDDLPVATCCAREETLWPIPPSHSKFLIHHRLFVYPASRALVGSAWNPWVP